MKLMIAIIQDEYINKVARVLMSEKVQATKLSSTGGFLKSGNTTLLIGCQDDKVDYVVELIKGQCKSNSVKEGDMEITVGGANIFILNIDDYARM